MARQDIFLDKEITDLLWSVRDILNFSFKAKINEAIEGDMNALAQSNSYSIGSDEEFAIEPD